MAKTAKSASKRARLPLGLRLHAYADMELAHAVTALGWTGSRRHAGLHLARKHLRRVRAVLALGHAALGPGSETLDRRVRRALRSLGRVRDAQAMLETIERLAEEGAPQKLPRHAALRTALRRERDALLSALLERDPDLARLRRSLQAVRGWLIAAPWKDVHRRHVDAGLRRSERRLDKAAKAARKHANASTRHRWRRRWRRLRQQATALEAAGCRTPALHELAGHWSSVLGEEHDLHVLRLRLNRYSAVDAGSREAWRAAIKQALRRRRAVTRDLAH